MNEPIPEQDAVQVQKVAAITIAEYDRVAVAYRHGTADHDVSQNIAALLEAIEGEAPHVILDLGCGPGRDLRRFTALGHEAVGLDGSGKLSAMARAKTDCEVVHQDFLALDLPSVRFDGIFASASLFHVPSSQLASSGSPRLAISTTRRCRSRRAGRLRSRGRRTSACGRIPRRAGR